MRRKLVPILLVSTECNPFIRLKFIHETAVHNLYAHPRTLKKAARSPGYKILIRGDNGMISVPEISKNYRDNSRDVFTVINRSYRAIRISSEYSSLAKV
jgi:hypothetical protein